MGRHGTSGCAAKQANLGSLGARLELLPIILVTKIITKFSLLSICFQMFS